MASNTNPFEPEMRQQATSATLRPNAGANNQSLAANRQSGAAALGLGLMSMDDSDSDDDEPAPRKPTTRAPPPPAIVAPKPGYVNQVNQINQIIDLARPEPAHSPAHVQLPSELASQSQYPRSQSPMTPRTPSTEPHPLRAPMTPIQPVFARPQKKVEPSVQFQTPIMRSGSEDVLIPRDHGNDKGDKFWKRFSMVAHMDETTKPHEKKETWLAKHQTANSRMSAWVWCAGFFFLVLVGGAAGFGYYMTHREPTTTIEAPRTVGGERGNHGEQGSGGNDTGVAGTGASSGRMASSSVIHLVPTHTVARREAAAVITGAAQVHANLRRRQNRIAMLD